MRAVGVSGYVVNGAEASAVDVLEITDRAVSWTVQLPHAAVGETFTSDDPAVIAFVRQAISYRTLPGPAQPTSGAATPA